MGKINKIKGGKADEMSVEDISKKHNVSLKKIKKQLKLGEKVEMEHVDDKSLAREISMDHLEEIPDYYTRLDKMEKEAKKELSTEAKRFMSLAGIKEDKKKFLKNESFLENHKPNKKEDDDFIIYEFEQIQFEPGDSDDLYHI